MIDRKRNSQLRNTYSKEGKYIDHYQTFLDLWKDADSGIAEDARKRLAGLKELL